MHRACLSRFHFYFHVLNFIPSCNIFRREEGKSDEESPEPNLPSSDRKRKAIICPLVAPCYSSGTLGGLELVGRAKSKGRTKVTTTKKISKTI